MLNLKKTESRKHQTSMIEKVLSFNWAVTHFKISSFAKYVQSEHPPYYPSASICMGSHAATTRIYMLDHF